MFFRYILKKYVKNFLISLFSLSFLYLLIDFIANFSKLPKSVNMQILYSVYVLGDAFDNFFALALVFGFLYTLYELIKYNYLVSFYSLGFSKKKFLYPVLFFSFFVYFAFLFLNTTNYAYFKQKAKNIIHHNKLKKRDLFLKHNDKIVYIEELKPLLKKAVNLKIFVLDKRLKVKKIVTIKEATYKDGVWIGKDVNVECIMPLRIKTEHFEKLKVLKNFEPIVLSNLKKLDSLSLKDAFVAIKVFKDIDVDKVVSIIIYKIISPLSLIFLIVYFLYLSPIHQRISNIAFFMIKSFFLTIFIWGINLLIFKFTKQGVISYYSLFLPLLFVIILDIYAIKKENE